MEITKAERQQLKARGYLANNDGIHFTARIVTRNGVLTAEQMQRVSAAAQQFGNGNIALTVRTSLELPGVAPESIEALERFLEPAGLSVGGTGPKVRPVIACKGSYCQTGRIDTLNIALLIHERFYEGYRNVKLPHKFKIGVGGCPNNCVKPNLNDFGIVGYKASSDGDVGSSECQVFLGGRWGRETQHGKPLSRIVTIDEALDLLEKALLLFRRDGQPGERFGQTVERLGMEAVEAILWSDELLESKAEILSA